VSNPVDCRYYYGNFYRGRDVEECRLIARNRENQRPWKRALCDTCPVPGILRETTCKHLALEASVERKFGLFDRVSLYAICTEHIIELKNPKHCPPCEAEAKGEKA